MASSSPQFKKNFAIALALALIAILFMTQYATGNTIDNIKWPPVVEKCPDYWIDESKENDGSKCVNAKQLGSCKRGKNTSMNFNVSPFVGSGGKDAKKTWAENCKVLWEGITK